VSRRATGHRGAISQSGYVRRNISPANFPSPIQIAEIVLPAGARVAYETGARDVSIHQADLGARGNRRGDGSVA